MDESKKKRIKQVGIFIIFDVIAILITYLIAVVMFMVLDISVNTDEMRYMLPFIIIFKIVVFAIFGMYNMLANHIGFEDVIKISFATAFTNVSIVVFIWLSDMEFMYKSTYFFHYDSRNIFLLLYLE